jgi:hypothetical protein
MLHLLIEKMSCRQKRISKYPKEESLKKMKRVIFLRILRDTVCSRKELFWVSLHNSRSLRKNKEIRLNKKRKISKKQINR